MPLNPPLRLASRVPLTVAVALASIGLSARWWLGGSLAGCEAPGDDLLRAPWVLLTSAFPHVNIIHLVFNLSWWWYFGARLELAWGAMRLAAVSALLAIISSAAEHALFGSGVGLSGIIYGFCTLLWVVQHRHPILAGTVTRRVMELFAVWFFVCIVLTITGVLPVGNAAHGFGALAGWLLGRCIIAEPSKRTLRCVILAGVLLASVLGATVARPWINISAWTTSSSRAGALAIKEGRYAEAITLLERARDKSPEDPIILTNLGIAYQHERRFADAIDVFRLAVQTDSSYRDKLAPSIASMLDLRTASALKRSDLRLAAERAAESLTWQPQGTYADKVLKWIDAHPPPSAQERMLPQSTSEDAPQ